MARGDNASHNEDHNLFFGSRNDFAGRAAGGDGTWTRCGPGRFRSDSAALRHSAAGRFRAIIYRAAGRANSNSESLHRHAQLDSLSYRDWLDRHRGEQGLLGMAFDPNYATNGKFYLNFTVPGGAFGNGVTHVSQFTVSANPDIADPNSERILLRFDHPQANHNGGWIGFSPRAGDANNLYIATGDGGGGNDQGTGHIEPGGNAQNLTTLLGKMLRIHVNSTAGTYTIPPNNPFIGVTGARGEIWAFGLRNPFRNSFDRQTGRMFIGDVGQGTREEIDVQQATNPGGGENYGWRVREGSIQNPAYPGTPTPPGAIDPIFDYPRSVGQTVIGGYVYRGQRIQNLRGLYVFADYLGPDSGPGTGQVFSLNYDGTGVSNFQNITSQLFPTSVGGFALSNPSSLGEDANGELYITDIGNGSVFKIVASAVKSDFNDGQALFWQNTFTGQRHLDHEWHHASVRVNLGTRRHPGASLVRATSMGTANRTFFGKIPYRPRAIWIMDGTSSSAVVWGRSRHLGASLVRPTLMGTAKPTFFGRTLLARAISGS